MAGYRDKKMFPRSHSMDPNMTYPCPSRSINRSANANNLFDLSSLNLDAKSPSRRDNCASQDISMLSPLSDRSIEPMSVSDISDRDLEDDIPNPLGRGNHDSDSESVGKQWFWSIKGTESTDGRSVQDDALSCASGLTEQSNIYRSTTQTLTQRRPHNNSQISDSDSDSDASNTHSIKSVRQNTVRITQKPLKQDIPNRRSCWSCMRVIHFLVLMTIISTIVLLAGKDFQVAMCKHGLRINLTELHTDLDKHVFGQHIAVSTVMSYVADLMHSQEHNMTVLSFHGWTGIGKNYISSFLAKHVDENHVHKIIIPMEMAHNKDSSEHREHIFQRITKSITTCRVNLFIIDEVDKASEETILGLHEALKNLTEANLEQTKVIVLLLSNSGGSAINRYYLDQLSAGHQRESVNHEEVVTFMLRVDEAEIHHEWHISLYQEGVINAIVPFLPLEKSHVSQCAEHYITNSRPMLGPSDTQDIVERVLEQMSFFPQGLELFSNTGCRGVKFKVDLTVD